jgi:hypothetical protein
MTSKLRTILPRAFAGALLALAVLAIACDGDGDDDGGNGAASPAVTADTTEGTATEAPPATDETPQAEGEMSITSSTFGDNEAMPAEHTCESGSAGTSPPLAFDSVPEEAAALALIVTDIDGPGGDFVHWTVMNIDPSTTAVPGASVPAGGVEGRTGRGDPGYFGPCPPAGTHRYVFDLYALDEPLTLDPATAGKPEMLAAMDGHILATAQLTGTYERAGG